jgi:Kae1-associated kinase Bud32
MKFRIIKLIGEGSEAKIYLAKFLNKELILKIRKQKRYRLSTLNEKIIKNRTKLEGTILHKLKQITNAPHVYYLNPKKGIIAMEYIKGINLRDYLLSKKYPKKTLIKLAKEISKIHKNKIALGDLTTANIIKKGSKFYFIDTGLGKINANIEELGTDLLCFKKAFISTHGEKLWNIFEKNYENKDILNKMYEIEKRGRYL